MKNLQELEEKYKLELDKIVKTIKKQKPKTVLLQFPDGLKPWATAVCDYLEAKIKTDIEIKIWSGTCFGACDVPKTNAELVIQFGHARWS